MILPENLTPGEKVYFTGFRDIALGMATGNVYMRSARFIRVIDYHRTLYEFKFDHGGYIEHWDRFGLLYALNGHAVPTSYGQHDWSPERHVMYLNHKKEKRHGRD